jgi:predicted component of type VI protein secretion system
VSRDGVEEERTGESEADHACGVHAAFAEEERAGWRLAAGFGAGGKRRIENRQQWAEMEAGGG